MNSLQLFDNDLISLFYYNEIEIKVRKFNKLYIYNNLKNAQVFLENIFVKFKNFDFNINTVYRMSKIFYEFYEI